MKPLKKVAVKAKKVVKVSLKKVNVGEMPKNFLKKGDVARIEIVNRGNGMTTVGFAWKEAPLVEALFAALKQDEFVHLLRHAVEIMDEVKKMELREEKAKVLTVVRRRKTVSKK